MADLGPLVGVNTKTSEGAPPTTQAQTNTRAAAQKKERSTNGERVLPASTPVGERLRPTGKFEGGRLKAIDVEVKIAVAHVKAHQSLQVNNLTTGVDLQGGVLVVDPLTVELADGRALVRFDLDAR